VRDQPGAVIKQGEKKGMHRPIPYAQNGAIHDIGHPQRVGAGHVRVSSVLRRASNGTLTACPRFPQVAEGERWPRAGTDVSREGYWSHGIAWNDSAPSPFPIRGWASRSDLYDFYCRRLKIRRLKREHSETSLPDYLAPSLLSTAP